MPSPGESGCGTECIFAPRGSGGSAMLSPANCALDLEDLCFRTNLRVLVSLSGGVLMQAAGYACPGVGEGAASDCPATAADVAFYLCHQKLKEASSSDRGSLEIDRSLRSEHILALSVGGGIE